MVRVFGFPIETQDGTKYIVLASMSWKQAEEHHKATKELADKGATSTNEQWLEKTFAVVNESMRRAGATGEIHLAEDYDLKTINAMYLKILEESSLRVPAAGEAKAA